MIGKEAQILEVLHRPGALFTSIPIVRVKRPNQRLLRRCIHCNSGTWCGEFSDKLRDICSSPPVSAIIIKSLLVWIHISKPKPIRRAWLMPLRKEIGLSAFGSGM